jgi:hypothetical protein
MIRRGPNHHESVRRSKRARQAVACPMDFVRYSPMESIRAIALLCRLLVIVSLVSLGFGAPAMAASGPPDCMAMMQSAQMIQSDHASTPDKMPDSGKSCPFADLCATAAFFVEPAPASHFVSLDPIEVALLPFDDQFGDGLTPIPPSRPPRS